MDRRKFLKKLGIGSAVAISIPAVVSAVTESESDQWSGMENKPACESYRYDIFYVGDHTVKLQHDPLYDTPHSRIKTKQI